MKYLVTLSNGEQSTVESDLNIAEFAKGYSLTTDIHPLPSETVEVESKSVTKRKKTQDAE